MKKYFITGLVVLLPLALTIAIVLFVFNLLTQPFAGITQAMFQHYHWLEYDYGFISSAHVRQFVSQVFILLALFFGTVLLGIIGRWVFVHYFIRFWDRLFKRIPFISTVYKTSQDVIRTIFTNTSKSFKQVVMVPFPSPETYSIGLVTRENFEGLADELSSNLVAVFVPTTPNPTSGFLMMFKSEDLIYLDMKVEDAFKYIVSCGVINTSFKQQTSEEISNNA